MTRFSSPMPSVPGQDVLPPDLNQRLLSELRPGERVAWTGRQRAGAAMWPAVFFVPFGLLFGGGPLVLFVLPAFGVAYFGGGGGTRSGPPAAFGCFGMIFVLLGLALALSPVWLRRAAKRTVYAVTDRRAVVMRPRAFGGITVQTFMPDRLTGMTRTEKADGSGSLIFEQFTERMGTGSRTVRRGFMNIDRVREVENLILTTLVQGRARGV